jgi:hypothetical protein
MQMMMIEKLIGYYNHNKNHNIAWCGTKSLNQLIALAFGMGILDLPPSRGTD